MAGLPLVRTSSMSAKAKAIKIGIHLVINILSVAFSSFCYNILMSPYEQTSTGPIRSADVSRLASSIYKSVVYTSINANTYAALVA
ncbi:uncharacterized protein BO80DRAFT_450110 [Aspergillus ibericus CBS 121593]|uniref:Uncharacterized protein n=1 Tax=Aspergillus ibericus CBS 121593 TaxID=1448316 RepID=A0A395GJJ3_9EURO|nr:hypothetical protein BO80DRAFT_450110 [Aspergillus ibericus CBS 121593]RAK95534.1 hypothetical protein BO80DRAFT_450110 [Aspergillus ibericus CBS 121593]